MPGSQTDLSVVVLALNEQAALPRALRSTALPGVERIVVDGGSSDGTPRLARALGADRVIVSAPGRARQMDAGYRASRAPVVLFLHADTRLEEGWREALRRALEEPHVAGGAFLPGYDAPGWQYRLLERSVGLRSRWLLTPYGDQALFVRRAVLDAAGGIANVPMFEDLDLVREIRTQGRLALVPRRAFSSVRRYERNGYWRTIARNQLALAAWMLDLDRDRVAAWYRRRPAR